MKFYASLEVQYESAQIDSPALISVRLHLPLCLPICLNSLDSGWNDITLYYAISSVLLVPQKNE